MKSHRNILIIILLSLLTFTACDKLPMNGVLDGMWQLLEVEHNNQTETVKAKGIYLSFQMHTVQFDAEGQIHQFFSLFEHSGRTLRIYNICKESENATSADDNQLLDESEIYLVEKWGIYHTDEPFQVLQLNSDGMILQSEDAKLKFRKI